MIFQKQRNCDRWELQLLVYLFTNDEIVSGTAEVEGKSGIFFSYTLCFCT